MVFYEYRPRNKVSFAISMIKIVKEINDVRSYFVKKKYEYTLLAGKGTLWTPHRIRYATIHRTLSWSIPTKRTINDNFPMYYYRIEHLEPPVLESLPKNLFGQLQPHMIILTTPNADFNVLFPGFSGFRHWDHKFEWRRHEFKEWLAFLFD